MIDAIEAIKTPMGEATDDYLATSEVCKVAGELMTKRGIDPKFQTILFSTIFQCGFAAGISEFSKELAATLDKTR